MGDRTSRRATLAALAIVVGAVACSHGGSAAVGMGATATATDTATATATATTGSTATPSVTRSPAAARPTTSPTPSTRRTATATTGPATQPAASPSRQPVGARPKPSASAAPTPKGVTHDIVMMSPFRFSPAALVIAVGDWVRVTNKDTAGHTFTDSPVFDSGNVAPGSSYTYRFSVKGTFNFVCSYHQAEQMKGTVTVG